MVWFKVDDGFNNNRKVKELRRGGERLRAIGLWTLSGSYSADEGLGGLVPESVVIEWGATQKDVDALIRVGLWERVEGAAAAFHDWDHYQPDAATLAAQRAKESVSGQLGNHRRWHVKRGVSVPDCEFCYRVPDQDPDGGPDTYPESGANRVSIGSPSPVPVPDKEDPMPSGIESSRPGAELTHLDRTPTSQTLLAEWIDHCSQPPPGRVKGHVAREVKAMLDEGIPYDRVRAGLAEWNSRGLHPSTLASVVHELANRKTVTNGKQQATDDLFQRALVRAANREDQP